MRCLMKWLIAATVAFIVAINFSSPLERNNTNMIDHVITQGIGK